MKELLDIRKRAKSKKPDFTRQDSHKKKRLSSSWRRPKGLQSKLRLKKAGKGKKVSSGYSSPSAVRGLDRNGLKMVNISTLAELSNVDAKTESVVISSAVGNKKRVEIIKEARSKNITIVNIRNADEFVKAVEGKIADKKKAKEEQKKKEKAASKKKEDKKLADKVKSEDKKDSEEEKEAAKKEKDKVLTRRER